MNEYQNEPKLAWWHYLVPVLIFLALGFAGGIEHADGQEACQDITDEITAAYIRGYNAGLADDTEGLGKLPGGGE